MNSAVHFIGFRDTGTFWRAVRIFGYPDFWDTRAAYGGEYVPGDIRVFAKGTDKDEPSPYTFDDSREF